MQNVSFFIVFRRLVETSISSIDKRHRTSFTVCTLVEQEKNTAQQTEVNIQ